MDKKGEMNTAGLVIMVAVTLIVGLVLFQVIAQEVGSATHTTQLVNQSLPATTTNGTVQYITNCRALSDVLVWNASNDVEVADTGYTITNNVVHDGALSVSILPAAPVADAYNLGVWTVDGTCQPLTYIADAGARSIAGLIAIFFALAVLVIALVPTLRNDFLSLIGR